MIGAQAQPASPLVLEFLESQEVLFGVVQLAESDPEGEVV
jgi:hypothetical protein